MKRSLFPVLLTLTFGLFGQDYNFKIEWFATDSTPSFRAAVYENASSDLPCYTFNLPWNNNETLPVIDIKVDSASIAENTVLKAADLKLTGSSPVLKYALAAERHRMFVQVSVLPFFRNDEGELMKVEKFTVSLHEETPIATLKSSKKGVYNSKSVLADGNWYKIRVSESGIFKLSYENLIDIGLENPALVRVYGAGAIQLPEDFSKGHYDDLSAVAIYMEKGSDGIFGPGDYILFYGRGPVKWTYNETSGRYSHHLHDYSLYGSYFLTDSKGAAESPVTANLSSATASTTVTSYDMLAYREEEKYNILLSGRRWLDDVYSITVTNSYPFSLPGLLTDEPVSVNVMAAASSIVQSYFTVSGNTTELGTIYISPLGSSSYTSIRAYAANKVFSYTPGSESFTINLNYARTDASSKGWLDYITINARGALTFLNSQMTFSDGRSVGTGKVAQFSLSSAPDNLKIWEITDESLPRQVNFTRSGSKAEFKIASDSLRRFIAFRTDGSFPSPDWDSDGGAKIDNQNLHGTDAPDMIIVYYPEFKDEAERLAQHRRERDGLNVLAVTEEEVFNEFSSGTPDISAVRNFLKMYYDSGTGMPRYLLLFGDGSVDNRNHGANNTNMILTYQSEESFNPTASYVSDDYYGLLDTGEDLYYGLLDIGIGRFPVSTLEEATAVVDKMIAYDDPANMGDWRNYVCFIGDDEDSNTHMTQADGLATNVGNEYPAYNINKIYLDAYQQITTSTGEKYPDVMQAINDQMNQGALLINYTGHGGINGLAHEQVVTINSINNWSNKNKLPLFMTATCEFSRYDEYDANEDLEKTSAGEYVLLNPDGGGIGLFTTTRLVYSYPNLVLNDKFYDIVFDKDSLNNNYRLGDIIAYSKNKTGAGINKRNFTLLGDPAQQLAYPVNRIIADSINHISVDESADTVSALDYVTVSGYIETQAGEPCSAFEGILHCVVFDKEREMQTLANDGGTPMTFKARTNVLYKGMASVQDGKFSFSFYVPKDINYSLGYGKISFYANDSISDAHGATSRLVIGGNPTSFFDDAIAPDINVYINDSLFRNGGITDPDPILYIKIRDDYGINTTGNGIGHDLTATLDDDRSNSIVMNSYYQSDINSYNAGTVTYPYYDLEEGLHTISVKVWDIHNNSSEEEVSFVVVSADKFILEDLFNYPNPFSEETFFNITHNRPDQNFEVTIDIYNIAGEHVRRISENVYSSGYRIDPITWDGRTDNGATLSEGIYIFRVSLKNDSGESATGSGKLLLVN